MNGGADITVVYNSPSLTTVGKAAAISVDSVSGFCMSCHDGTTAMGAVKNKASVGNVSIDNVNSNRLGVLSTLNAATVAAFTDMTKQHPVGFSYVNAQAEDAGLASGARLWDAPNACRSVITTPERVNPSNAPIVTGPGPWATWRVSPGERGRLVPAGDRCHRSNRDR